MISREYSCISSGWKWIWVYLGFWKVLRCQGKWSLLMEKPSLPLWKLQSCSRYMHYKNLSLITVLFHLLWVALWCKRAIQKYQVDCRFAVQSRSLLTWHWLHTKPVQQRKIAESHIHGSVWDILCKKKKKKAKEERISRGAQTEIMHAVKCQERELSV